MSLSLKSDPQKTDNNIKTTVCGWCYHLWKAMCIIRHTLLWMFCHLTYRRFYQSYLYMFLPLTRQSPRKCSMWMLLAALKSCVYSWSHHQMGSSTFVHMDGSTILYMSVSAIFVHMYCPNIFVHMNCSIIVKAIVSRNINIWMMLEALESIFSYTHLSTLI